ncbi:hypothetical protein [Bacillus sp. TL12]|uniref:hypothetical protein n=1 Tax=Bacillus sp. TL12 TaxID=2894756 RepID=UPI001F527794|nr:hypothetical protein [Bacillus sp. TL12]MCI0766545.1 hypothetical protein [Bacillus sp. TL12]
MLVLYSTINVEWLSIIQNVLLNLVEKSSICNSELIMAIESQGILVKKAKHSRKGIAHRARLLAKS